MEDYLTMNANERERMRVLSKVKEGDKGLIHRNRGKQSNHRKVFKEEVLEIYQKRYYNLGFDPPLLLRSFWKNMAIRLTMRH